MNRKMKTNVYQIQKASETLIEQQTWNTIDANSNIHSWWKLITPSGEELSEEITEELEEELRLNDRKLWDLEDYYGTVSKVEEELNEYFEKNNIDHNDGSASYWDHNTTSAYGVDYERWYMEVVYEAELTEKQVEELEELGYDVSYQKEEW